VAQIAAGDVVFDVDAVAFDKDGTLIDLDAAWGPAGRHWVEAAAGEDPELASDLALELGYDFATERLVKGGLFAVGTVGQLYETTVSVLVERGIDRTAAEDIARTARKASAEAGEKGNLVALGDVLGTMRSLRETGLQLAVVSSDDRSAIDAAISFLGVGPLLAAVVAGDEGLPAKPAPDALLAAADRMGVAADRLLYVGDSWVDAAAGLAAGIAGTVLVGEPTPQASELASALVPTVDGLKVVSRKR
jgi:phosphoglycolate phosphatase-like HAD superfamily hydrolase